jgi:hypothetical protein
VIPDQVAVYNERVKLLAGFLNAVGIALIGVGVLAPLAASRGAALSEGLRFPQWPAWLLAGLALHGVAHYVLGYFKKARPP